MSENDSKKKIACIFEEEQVFLTKNGMFYGYENIDGVFKCRRLNNIEINRFLYRIRDTKEFMVMSKTSVRRKPLRRKFEDSSTLEA